MLRAVTMYLRLAHACARSMYQYRLAFGLIAVASALAEGGMLWLIVIVVARFQGVAGWQWPEIAFLYGMGLTAFSFIRLIGSSLDHFDDRVVSGRFDAFLTRPVSPLLLTMADGFNPFQLGSLATGIAVLAVALRAAGLSLGAREVVFLIVVIVGGGMIMLSTYLVVAAVAFWTAKSAKLTDFFGAAGREFVNYPLSIYPLAVRMLLTLAIPLAFTTYYPARKGRTMFRKNFAFNRSWRGKQYALKQVGAIVAPQQGNLVVVTVYVYYF